MQQDFARRTESQVETSRQTSRKRRPLPFSSAVWMAKLGRGLGWVIPSIVLFVVLIIFLGTDSGAEARTSQPHEEWLSVAPFEALAQPVISKKTTLKAGDNSVAALGRLGFSHQEAMQIIAAAKPVYALKGVRAGHNFERFEDSAKIDVYYVVDKMQRLHLRKTANGSWQAEMHKTKVMGRQMVARGTIQDSLFLAAAQAGLDDRTTMNLVDIFSWDIDFSRDLRKGDTFRVVYEELFDEQGKTVGNTILAAEFINQGKVFRAIRYTLSNGKTDYFSPDGKSMRKTYLKSPVKYSRISSRFTTSRKHPVLGYTRAHRGVDYASPSGTPIRTIGDGRVTFAGWKGGYGRFIEIQHLNSNHKTRYGHMRRIAKGMRKGARVRQGQIIGYVGMSGLATGPHLHFEFRVRGRAVNPLTVRHTPAKPVPKQDMAGFRKTSTTVLKSMEATETMLAWG